MNPLKQAYKNGGTAPAAPAKTPAAAVGATTATPSTAAVQTTQIPPAAGGTRNLSALRAALAAGFVNPPEAGEAVNEDTLAPRTVETEDGGAQAAPGYVEMKGGLVVKAPVDTAGETPPASTAAAVAGAGELSRGQKAAATRAANKAAKAQPVASAAAPEPSDTSEAPPAASSVAFSLSGVSTDDLLAEIYKRVAARFI